MYMPKTDRDTEAQRRMRMCKPTTIFCAMLTGPSDILSSHAHAHFLRKLVIKLSAANYTAWSLQAFIRVLCKAMRSAAAMLLHSAWRACCWCPLLRCVHVCVCARSHTRAGVSTCVRNATRQWNSCHLPVEPQLVQSSWLLRGC